MNELSFRWMDLEGLTSVIIDCIYDAETLSCNIDAQLKNMDLVIDDFKDITGTAYLERVCDLLNKSCKALTGVVQVFNNSDKRSLLDDFGDIVSGGMIALDDTNDNRKWVEQFEKTLLARCGNVIWKEQKLDEIVNQILGELGTNAVFGDAQRAELVSQLTMISESVCDAAKNARELLEGMPSTRVMSVVKDVSSALKDACVLTMDVTGPFTVPTPSVRVYWVAIKSTVTSGSSLFQRGKKLANWIANRRLVPEKLKEIENIRNKISLDKAPYDLHKVRADDSLIARIKLNIQDMSEKVTELKKLSPSATQLSGIEKYLNDGRDFIKKYESENKIERGRVTPKTSNSSKLSKRRRNHPIKRRGSKTEEKKDTD